MESSANGHVIIMGCGPTWVDCPFDTETWSVNYGYALTKGRRLDKLFFFDNPYHSPKDKTMLKDLAEMDCEIISPWRVDLPNYRPYPVEEIIKHFHSRYFANTIAYMIAYALYTGKTTIDLYGVDHIAYTEYHLAKACVEHWIGRALGMGIEVNIARGSALCRTNDGRLYGIDGLVKDPVEMLLA